MVAFLYALFLFYNLLYIVRAQTDFQPLTSDLNTYLAFSVSIVPRHYDIDLTFTIDAEDLVVTGESNITFTISSTTQILEIQYGDRITKLMLFSDNGTLLFESFDRYYVSYNVRGRIIFEIENTIPRGRYTLYLKYHSRSLKNVFTIPYLRNAISKLWFIYTNFQSNGARYLFPCWDKIGTKTTFSLTVKHDKTYTALSNTKWQRVEPRGEITTTQFRKTNKLYTSDVAIIIYPSDVFHMKFVPNLYGIAYHRFYRKPQFKFAFDKLISTKSYLFSYTQYDINLDMQYVIIPGIYTESIPSSELIIFRENAILYNETVDSVAQKLEVMRLVTRTYLNLWFHHVVTPSSRTQIWVNEALAAFFQIQINIEQDLPSLFQVQANHESLHVDRNNLLMPIKGNTSDSFQNTFLSTIKAPVIFSMLKYVLTPPVFHEGVLKYLRTHKSKYASSDHLWDAMKSAINNSAVIDTDYDFKAMINSWIRQPNYPIIEVKRYSNYEIVISRRVTENATDQIWWIPITYTLRTGFKFSNTVPYAWLSRKRSMISLDVIRKTDWIIVNIQQSGYYRVNYDAWNWNLLANELNSDEYTNIHVLNRAKLIDDAYYFMMTEHLKYYDIFLKLTSYLSRETDYVAWYPMFKIMEYLSIYFPFPESNVLKIHMRTILDPVLLKIGFHDRDDENDISKMLRQEVLKWSCLLDNTQCKYIAYSDLKLHLKNPENHTFLSNRKEWIYCNALLSNDSRTRKDLFLYWKRTKSYKQISEYLACMKDPYEIYTFFQFIMTNDNDTMTDTERLLLFYSVIAKCARKYMQTILNFYDAHEFRDNKAKTFSILINHIYSLDDIDELKKYVRKIFLNITIQQNLFSTFTARKRRIKQHMNEFSILFNYKPTPNTQDPPKMSLPAPIDYDVTPLHYNIELKILNYTKHELNIICTYNITIMIHHKTRVIKMDYFKHEFKHISRLLLFYSNEASIYVPSYTKIENHVFLIIFQNRLPIGEYVLKMIFHNILYDREGCHFLKFNQVYYGSLHWFDVVYFNLNEAAHIFPCWIDPAIKTTFNISLHHSQWHTALSNMPIESTENIDDEYAMSYFYKTASFSVDSLVIVIVHKLCAQQISVFYDIKQYVWCKRQFSTYANYMSDVIHRVTIYFNYLAVLRDISKIDHLIVQDVHDDTIETYGFILYDEEDIAYDEQIYPIGRKLQVTSLIARTVANQLFGDMVDASEMHGLWLKDGLPTYFAYRAITQVAPEGQLSKFFSMLVQHESLHLDVNNLLKHPHTVIKHPSGSKAPKSVANYIRAPAIVRMLQHIICEDIYEFIKLIREYLHTSRFHVKTVNHFYDFIQKVNCSVLHTYAIQYNIPKLQVLMNTWTTAMHYPVVHVTREYSTNKTLLSQENFNNLDRKKWWIPITYTTQTNINFSDTLPKAWLKPNKDYFLLSETVQKDEWIIVNLQQSGYYRVNYDPTNWNLIAKYLNSENYSKIDVLNRAQIIDDAYHLMMMHKLDYDIFINLTSYLARETDYVAWYPMFKILEYLSPFLPFEESKHFKNHMKTLLTDLNKVIDGTIYEISKEESLLSICLKQEAARWACILNDANCALTANSKLIKHLKVRSRYELLPGWKEWTICNGLSIASNVTWHVFWNRYRKTFVNRTLNIISCSGGFANPNFLSQFKSWWENRKLQKVECNLLYFVFMMNGTNSLDITLANLKDHIYYCATAPRDITKVLTVIINRSYFAHQFAKIGEFIQNNMQRVDSILVRYAIITREYLLKDQKQAFSMLIKKTQFF